MENQPDLVPKIINNKPRSHNALVVILFIILIAVASAGVAYSVYAWKHNNNVEADVSSKNSQITTLSNEISSLKTTVATIVSGNVIPIKELGISITVPDSIKDLTYSYTSSGTGVNKIESVSFSTKALTDQYNANNECTSYGIAPPLGEISKRLGKYSANLYSSELVKQFADYYITYSSPQAACASAQTTVPTELGIFKTSLSTVKEL